MPDPREALENAKHLAAAGDQDGALSALRAGFSGDTEGSLLTRAARWAAKTQWPTLRPLRLALLGGGTLDHLRDFLVFWTLLEGIRLEVYLPPYDTWKMEILNPDSRLYRFRPEVAWLFATWRDAGLKTDPMLDNAAADRLAEERTTTFTNWWRALADRLPGTQIVQNTLDPAPHEPFGNYAAALPGGANAVLRHCNHLLSRSAAASGVSLFDYERQALELGLKRWHNPSYWFHSKHPFAPEFSGRIGFRCARFLASLKGVAKKAVVLDLDNTLWGGVIGDDGLEGIRLGSGEEGEAFVAFQEYLKELATRGVVLAVASKNEEKAAKEPFERHPDMRLRLDDIAVFAANWRNKADNIRDIAKTLNLGLDAFVFVDDNPAERDLVRRELPMLAVPEMPANPAEYVRILEEGAYFETSSFSKEDARRGRMYSENARRLEARSAATNMDEYLAGLEMVADSGLADTFHLPRMAQLINKSTPFNLSGARLTEAELRELAAREDHMVRWFSLRDRFGDHGLVAVVVLRRDADTLVVDAWVMSCRVLERGMEEFIMRTIVECAQNLRISRIVGRREATGRNGMTEGVYGNLGFSPLSSLPSGESYWESTTGGTREGVCHIRHVQEKEEING